MFRSSPLLLSLFAGLCACGPKTGPDVIAPPRETREQAPAWDQSAMERFGLNRSAPENSPKTQAQPAQRLVWDLPSGWTERPQTQMRLANFLVQGNTDAECFLTLLGGDGGGMLANINRWRSQMGLSPMEAAEVDGLPKARFMSDMAVLIDFEGSYSGMGGGEGRPGWRMLGLLLVEPQGSAFFKATGPSALLAAERENFLKLAASLRIEDAPAANSESSAPAAPASEGGGGAADKGKEMAGTIPTASAEALQWQPPAGWREGPKKSMRAVTYLVGPEPAVECYITVLPGESGGMRANINRWRDQLDASELSQAEVDALTRIPMLGSTGRLLEIDGTGASAGKKMLAALSVSSQRSVFVRLTGPKELLESEREHFRAFAASIQERK
jgi:hypothetical protein